MIQATGVSGAVRECLIVLTHWTVARTRKYQIVPTHCTCSQNKNITLAGPDIATWPGGLHHHSDPASIKANYMHLSFLLAKKATVPV